MIERIKELFFGTPHKREIIGRIRNHELSPNSYLASLSELDKKRVSDFIDFASDLDQSIGVGIAVTAVGNTVIPQAQRQQTAKYIDLRILNEAFPQTEKRTAAVQGINGAVSGYLLQTRSDFTIHDPMVFVTVYPDGLPIHISISGVSDDDMDTFLKKKREQDANFVLLYQSPQSTLQNPTGN